MPMGIKMNKNSSKTKLITIVGIATAMSVILRFIEIPFTPVYKFDFSIFPAIVGGLVSPLIGILVTILTNVIALIIPGTKTGGIGELANLIIGFSFILPFVFIIKKNNNKTLIASIISVIIMTAIGLLANWFILLPLFKVPYELRMGFIMTALPFNIIKGTYLAVLGSIFLKFITKNETISNIFKL